MIINITNGITPRRWLNQANPGLDRADLVTHRPRLDSDLEQLIQLIPFADDAVFQERFRAVKRDNKELRLARSSRNMWVST